MATADILGGEWRELRGERFLVIDRKYPPGHRHGHVAVADTLPPDEGCWSRFPLLDGSAARIPRDGRMLFLDLETTGLAGGAGTYAFLVGWPGIRMAACAVRQFFLSNFAAERVLLEAVADVADRCGAVVTYNGKSFDLPLIDTRFQLHRLETPFAGMPHVDMLHPARRLWRDDEDEGPPRARGGCRLSARTHAVRPRARRRRAGLRDSLALLSLRAHRGPRGLAAVMEHNRLDLVSLAMLTARASQLLEDGPATARTGREALGMGRLYERAGMTADARAAFLRAAEYRDGHGDGRSASVVPDWRT